MSDSQPCILNLAEHYGFSENPYDPTALGVSESDSELFVGREAEGRTLRAFLSSFERGAIVVEGGIGVGKTSFVNVQQFKAMREEAILPSLSVIELQAGMTPAEFLLSVLSNSLNSLRNLRPEAERESAFQKLAHAVEQTLTKTRAYQGGFSLSGGVGVSGGVGKSVAAANPNITLLPAVSKYLDDFRSLALEFDFDRVAVTVDNLETVDPRFLVQFMHGVRDLTLSRDGYLWVFIGAAGTRTLIAQEAPRVSELIVRDPLGVMPLSLEEVQQAIDARIRKFRLRENVEPPIDEDVVQLLYRASNGEFRYILNRCRDILFRTMLDFPTTRNITPTVAVPLLRSMTNAAIERANLTNKQKQVLAKLSEKEGAQPKDYKQFGFNSGPAFIRYLRDFYGMKLLDRRERGREVVYIPRGDVVLALRPKFIS